MDARVAAIIAAVDEMRRNGEDQKIHKNLPLAEKVLSSLETLDDPEEGPLGKALACQAAVDLLPEYDVPRLVLRMLRRELAWLEESDEQSESLTVKDVQAQIARLEDYIDVDRVSTQEFCEKYGRHLKFDPVERTQKWEEIYPEVEEECDRRLKGVPRGMGFCFGYWAARHDILLRYGIDWKSPHMMNPRVMFD